MLVKISGMDAAGKATQSKLLVENIKAHGIKTELLSFPDYESLTGKAIRGNLVRDWCVGIPYESKNATDEYTESKEYTLLKEVVFQALMTCNKFEHYEKIKAYADDPKSILVLDRYYLSGIIYGVANGVPREWVELIHKALPEPDVSLYLNISLEESIRRRPDRRDRIESDHAYLNRVRVGYLSYFEEKKDTGKYVVINGEQHMAKVEEDIYTQVMSRYKHEYQNIGRLFMYPK